MNRTKQLKSEIKRLGIKIRSFKRTELTLRNLEQRSNHLEKLLASVQKQREKLLTIEEERKKLKLQKEDAKKLLASMQKQREKQTQKQKPKKQKPKKQKPRKQKLQKPHRTKVFFRNYNGIKAIPLGLKCTLYKERAERFGCKVNDLTEAQARELLNSSPNNCPLCNKPFDNTLREKRKSLDHFIPLSKGGNNTKSNVWVVCYGCNTKKRATIPQQAH